MQIVQNYVQTGTSGGNAGSTNDAEMIEKYFKEQYGDNWEAEMKRQGYASGGYTGYGSPDEIAGVVHKGEYVLPADLVDQTSGKPKMLGNTIININVQGTFATSQAERRKVADQIVAALNQTKHSRLEAV